MENNCEYEDVCSANVKECFIDVEEAGGNGNTQPNPPRQLPLRKHHFFTYNNYDSGIIDVMYQTFKDKCYMFAFQEEQGLEETPHLQGVISCKYQMRTSAFGLPKQIHWEKCRNICDAYKYCTKDDTRNGRRLVFNYRPIREIQVINPTRVYQRFVLEILDTKPNERRIYWLFDRIGNVGKSSFCKYLVAKRGALFIDEGKKSDLMNLIYKSDMDKHDVVVIDIPRSQHNSCSYKTLESIKNGMICNTKYETGFKLFNSPHLIIFANFPPEISEETLSVDRLRIYEIDKNYNLTKYGAKEMNATNLNDYWDNKFQIMERH